MKRRPGASLIFVLIVVSLAASIALNVFLIFEWSISSTSAKNELMKKRVMLNSLIADGYHWLINKIDDGFTPDDINIHEDVELDDLKIFSKNAGQAYVSIYNISYDCTALVSHAANFKWRSSDGVTKFPAAKTGAFLIRAVYYDSSGSGIMLEAVITRGDKKLRSLEETWF